MFTSNKIQNISLDEIKINMGRRIPIEIDTLTTATTKRTNFINHDYPPKYFVDSVDTVISNVN